MARLESMVMGVLGLVLILSPLAKTQLNIDAVSPSPESYEDIQFGETPAEAPWGEEDDYYYDDGNDDPYSDFVDDCFTRFDFNCEKQVFEDAPARGHVSKDCCLKLIELGKDCHDALTESFTVTDENITRAQFEAKSKETWDKCVLDYGSQTHLP
ncbi:uncharacterized protein LOC110822859 [Carica papaya]|uniref:uncharacterized protein LOC110822859 n=1 Tax=Carica papaya TaxID=3649 RepID=UPI000B8C9203|nr:uncharacterized protein LOC110822859 [Carica papaya]